MTERRVLSLSHGGPLSIAAAAAPTSELPRPHVLIVDDQHASRAVCVSYCDLFDHTSETARTPAEAVEALKLRRFDVVVMNVHMDAAGGLEAMRSIRDLPCADETPIIGLAAPGRAEEAQRWIAAGLAGMVSKPVTAAHLFAAINSVLTPDTSTARSWAPAG